MGTNVRNVWAQMAHVRGDIHVHRLLPGQLAQRYHGSLLHYPGTMFSAGNFRGRAVKAEGQKGKEGDGQHGC